jgi:transposase-like protein
LARKRTATPPAEPQPVADQTTAAKLLGVTPRTLRNWRDNPACPRFPPYDLAALREFQRVHELGGSATRAEATDLQLAIKQETLKQEELKTLRMEHDLAEREGELLPRATEELAIATILTAHGDALDQVPDVVAGRVPKKVRPLVRDAVKSELDRCREDLAAQLNQLPASA